MSTLLMRNQFFVLVFVLLLTGCRGRVEPTRTDVSGYVTYNGEPIEDGEIAFIPELTSSNPPGAGIIKDGAYSLKANGGLIAGTYKVEFRAYQPTDTNISEGSPARPIGSNPRNQILADRFNKDSTETIEIDDDQPVTKDFELND